MSVSRWDPFQDLLAIQDEMNQVFGRARQGQAGRRVWAPALDISERNDAYVVTVEVPGVKADDLDITLEDGLLTIQGERQFTSEPSEQQYHRVERRYGSFRRSITLPSQVRADAIEAFIADARDAGAEQVCAHNLLVRALRNEERSEEKKRETSV